MIRCNECGSIDPSWYDARSVCCRPWVQLEPLHLTGWDWVWGSPQSIMFWGPSGCRSININLDSALARARTYVRAEATDESD